MGLSSLPESAIILAKYQGTLPGIPFCSIKDGHSECNTGMADYKQQAYMESLSANKKPSLSANKKLLDRFSRAGGEKECVRRNAEQTAAWEDAAHGKKCGRRWSYCGRRGCCIRSSGIPPGALFRRQGKDSRWRCGSSGWGM
ncbi:hypothetical protein HPP92_006755 [Vanilla planifolia]|uniref:Uncharacterized protein n=1 Tax=Vanilla planifolia TaxID=51239 RepID=A0A835V587_VANPL|nr:hypothetical protein HPP92_006755 [Vanilla planifolia]